MEFFESGLALFSFATQDVLLFLYKCLELLFLVSNEFRVVLIHPFECILHLHYVLGADGHIIVDNLYKAFHIEAGHVL